MRWNKHSLIVITLALLLTVCACAPRPSAEQTQESSVPLVQENSTLSTQESSAIVFHELPNGWQLSDFVVAGFDKDGPGDFGHRVTLDEGQLSRFAELLDIENWQELSTPIEYGLTAYLTVSDKEIGRFIAVMDGGEFGTVISLNAEGIGEKPVYTAPAKVAEEAKELAVELKGQIEELSDSPIHDEPTPLESIPLEQLAEAEPVAETTGFSIYLRGEDGWFLPELPYDDQRKTGDVIAACPGENGYILGQYDTDKDQWGTLSHLGNGLVCFNNYHELAFIDTDSWTDTGFTLDFQTPPEPNHRISSVARDLSSGEFVVIYQVSSYTVSPDGEVRPWLAYDNSDIGAQDAHMEFQRFDSQGRFLERVITDLEPRGMNDVADCLPNRYRDGKLTFLQKDYMGFLITCDLATGEISILNCESAFLTDGAELLYSYEYREDIPGAEFNYQWYELGEQVASLSLEEEQDSLTLAFDNMPEPLKLSQIDPEKRTAELTYQGLIFHRLDFNAGAIELAYEYPEEQLGEPILTGSDGRYQVYRLSLSAGGEARFEEMVARDGETGDFVRLGTLNNAGSMVVTGDHQLIVAYYGQLEACSLADGEWHTPLDKFTFTGGEELGRRALDVLYDEENRLILILSTDHFDPFREDFSEEMVGTMALEVYREDWTLLRAIDTGIAPPYSLEAYGPYSPGIRLEQPERLLLGKGEDVVEYLE